MIIVPYGLLNIDRKANLKKAGNVIYVWSPSVCLHGIFKK